MLLSTNIGEILLRLKLLNGNSTKVVKNQVEKNGSELQDSLDLHSQPLKPKLKKFGSQDMLEMLISSLLKEWPKIDQFFSQDGKLDGKPPMKLNLLLLFLKEMEIKRPTTPSSMLLEHQYKKLSNADLSLIDSPEQFQNSQLKEKLILSMSLLYHGLELLPLLIGKKPRRKPKLLPQHQLQELKRRKKVKRKRKKVKKRRKMILQLNEQKNQGFL